MHPNGTATMTGTCQAVSSLYPC